MKLCTFAVPGGSCAGVVDGADIVVLAGHTVRGLLEAGDVGMLAVRAALADGNAERVPLSSQTLLPPIGDPEKIICAGANYKDHVQESAASGTKIAGMDDSALDASSPVPCFNKFNSCLIGPTASIVRPSITKALDWEAELVIVIGRTAKAVPESDALGYVAGYMCGNDVTARDYQHSPKLNPSKQHFIGKTPDRSCPTGPFLVTRDEVPDPDALDLSLTVNGETMQASNTRHLIHGCANMIAYFSTLWTLKPGDLIFTGTPSGVGAARNPMKFLQPGDVVTTRVQGLGELCNAVVQQGTGSSRL